MTGQEGHWKIKFLQQCLRRDTQILGIQWEVMSNFKMQTPGRKSGLKVQAKTEPSHKMCMLNKSLSLLCVSVSSYVGENSYLTGVS